jgi:mannan endo-1,4-beta-mannosidase
LIPIAGFPLIGFNSYYLAYCSEASRRAALISAKQMGANVIRAWAFLDAAVAPAFQYFENGAIRVDDGPQGLERLDALIAAAEEFGLGLILPLVNYWPDFGGMPMYLNWLGIAGDVTNFYSSPEARGAYRAWVEHVLTRRNTVTGRLYSEEPGIFAWELANEPRCQIPGGRELLLDWVAEMSAFVKQCDASHLLAVGDEGFFYRRGAGHLYDGTYGVDFEAVLSLDPIDFGTYHFYPQNWGLSGNLECASQWIADHIAAGNRANKPVVLEEYGIKIDGRAIRSSLERDRWLDTWRQSVQNLGGGGALLWMLGCDEPDTCGYCDDYTIHRSLV